MYFLFSSLWSMLSTGMRETTKTGFGSACMDVKMLMMKCERCHPSQIFSISSQTWIVVRPETIFLASAAGLVFRYCTINWHPPPPPTPPPLLMHVIYHRGEFRLWNAGAPTVLVQSLQMIHNLCWVCALPESGHSSAEKEQENGSVLNRALAEGGHHLAGLIILICSGELN